MYYLLGDKDLHWLKPNKPKEGQGYALLDGNTLRVIVVDGKDILRGMQQDVSMYCAMLDGTMSCLPNIMALQTGVGVLVVGGIRIVQSAGVEIIRDGYGSLVFTVNWWNQLAKKTKCPVGQFNSLYLKWVFNLGQDVYSLNLIIGMYRLLVVVDLCNVGLLYMEIHGVSKRWVLSGNELDYSPRRDWFLGRLAKHRMFFGLSPLLSV